MGLVFFVAQPNTQMYCFFGLPISRLYTNVSSTNPELPFSTSDKKEVNLYLLNPVPQTLMDTLLCREYLRDLFKQRETVGTFQFAHFGQNVDLLQNEQFRTTATTGDMKLHVIPQDMTDMKFDKARETECRPSRDLGAVTKDFATRSTSSNPSEHEQQDALHDEDPC